MEFVEHRAQVIDRVRALRMARQLGNLPRRQVGENRLGLRAALVLELADLFLDVHRVALTGVTQLLDLAFQFGDRLFEVEEGRIHRRASDKEP